MRPSAELRPTWPRASRARAWWPQSRRAGRASRSTVRRASELSATVAEASPSSSLPQMVRRGEAVNNVAFSPCTAARPLLSKSTHWDTSPPGLRCRRQRAKYSQVWRTAAPLSQGSMRSEVTRSHFSRVVARKWRAPSEVTSTRGSRRTSCFSAAKGERGGGGGEAGEELGGVLGAQPREREEADGEGADDGADGVGRAGAADERADCAAGGGEGGEGEWEGGPRRNAAGKMAQAQRARSRGGIWPAGRGWGRPGRGRRAPRWRASPWPRRGRGVGAVGRRRGPGGVGGRCARGRRRRRGRGRGRRVRRRDGGAGEGGEDEGEVEGGGAPRRSHQIVETAHTKPVRRQPATAPRGCRSRNPRARRCRAVCGRGVFVGPVALRRRIFPRGRARERRAPSRSRGWFSKRMRSPSRLWEWSGRRPAGPEECTVRRGRGREPESGRRRRRGAGGYGGGSGKTGVTGEGEAPGVHAEGDG